MNLLTFYILTRLFVELIERIKKRSLRSWIEEMKAAMAPVRGKKKCNNFFIFFFKWIRHSFVIQRQEQNQRLSRLRRDREHRVLLQGCITLNCETGSYIGKYLMQTCFRCILFQIAWTTLHQDFQLLFPIRVYLFIYLFIYKKQAEQSNIV